MRIAVLEDEPAQMQYLVYTLEHQLALGDEEASCVPFDRGEALRRALRRETFDLLVLDWNVPDLDGIELLQWLRHRQRSDVPVIALSPRASERDVVQALSLGADDYVVRPLRTLEFTERIRRLVHRRQPDAAKAVERFGAWEFKRLSLTVTLDDLRETTGSS